VQGTYSSFGRIDLSVGTENCLKPEEYSECKQVLPTFIILVTADSTACQKAQTQRQQSSPCGVLPRAMTDYNTVDVMLFVVPEKLT
jgi:hypothetical protein